MAEVIRFQSLHETQMELVRDEDGEVLLRILSDSTGEALAEVFVDPAELVGYLERI